MTQDAGLKVKAWEHSAFHSHPYNPKPVLKLQGYHWKKHTNKIFLTVFFHFHLFNAVGGTPSTETLNTRREIRRGRCLTGHYCITTKSYKSFLYSPQVHLSPFALVLILTSKY